MCYSMKTKYIYISLLLFIPAFFIMASSTPVEEEMQDNKSIIKFSHQLHAEMEVDCATCHVNAAESTSLSDQLLPTMDECAACHDVEDEDNCSTCHYEGVLEPFELEKPDLIYSHKYHLETQDVECETCHSGLSTVDYADESESADPSMSTCYTCHNNVSIATNVCESCHVSTHNLIPQDHKQVSFFDNHKFSAGKGDAQCAMCHDEMNFCETCHTATNTIDETNTASDFYAPYSPHKYTDNAKVQKLTRAHSLDYRFTHGIDAKSKSSECQTCHQTESFCAECHTSGGGDYALSGVVPLSHTQSNFLTIGVGTGGGEHAVLAKRDMESCASCHDTYGADPSCILCHTDPDGLKGTNPKTHDTGFMKDVEGNWHSDKGSICFDCHTDPFAMASQFGDGFCGYCHK